jgi:luciferase family oxidoreductase group 1
MLLSVLDILSPVHLPRLVTQLDRLGYHRFWATEHHSPTQSASPTLVACLVASMTERMRVGTAGVLLNYACPAKVAEEFRLLELYFSGRIDLGVTASTMVHEELYLDGKPRPTRDSFEARVTALASFVRGDHDVVIGPVCPTVPALWLCGSSPASALLAGKLGMYFACHTLGAPSAEAVRTTITVYRDAYRGVGAPYSAIAAYGVCAETESAARQLWPESSGSPAFRGSPQACVDQLHALVSGCGADETVVHLPVRDIDARIAGYRLLAEAAALDIEPDEDAATDSLTHPAA